jgi:cbb3-type cytochrome oxidase maturation protein
MPSLDWVVIGLLLASATFFGTAAALALGWAIQSRQFDNETRDAESIFDADEPVGMVTDAIFFNDTDTLPSSR